MSIEKDEALAKEIAFRVRDAGGIAYYVGGAVRDRLLGLAGKDIDLEVHGISPEALEHILDDLGERTQMGASFGVYGLKHSELDIAMPRRETAVGRGHRDFKVDVDPFLGVKKAAMRRDFTINALMQDAITGQIVDSFGGQEDLKSGILRHVNDDTFIEDPLRVLRCAQFAARLGFQVAPETLELCRKMDLSSLARERVTGEMEKALLKSSHPGVFFSLLRDMERLDEWFPELKALIGIQQEPKYHPEGDVWNHTLLVLDAAAGMRENAREPLYFMLSALCHDLGKPDTTSFIEGRVRSFDHETAGQKIAERFLGRLTDEVRLKRYVLNMIALHMRPNQLPGQNAGKKAYMRMLDESVCPDDLLLLARADYLGQMRTPESYGETETLLRQMLSAYRELAGNPQVSGTDLMKNSLKPGPSFGKLLNYAHTLWLSGVPHREALRQVLGMAGLQEDERSQKQ